MKNIFVLFLLIGFFANAQSDKQKLFTFENKDNKEIETNFYIDKIYDGRQIKENIGTVQVSLFNTKVPANFKKPFLEELEQFFSVVYPKSISKKPISIRIDELYVSEITQYKENIETGYANVVFDIIERK